MKPSVTQHLIKGNSISVGLSPLSVKLIETSIKISWFLEKRVALVFSHLLLRRVRNKQFERENDVKDKLNVV